MKNEKYLHQFRVVAQHKCISTACNELFLSQSALTKNIKKVEERLGVELFKRLPRGMEITEYGEALLKRVKKMEIEYDYALQEINAIKTGVRAKLSIGVGTVWGEAILPEVIGKFYEHYPTAELEIVPGAVYELASELVEGRIDVLLGSMDYIFHPSENICNIPLTQENVVVVCSREHSLAQQLEVEPDQLANQNWIMYQQAKKSINDISRFMSQYSLPSAKIILNTTYLDLAVTVLQRQQCLMAVPEQLAAKLEAQNIISLPLTIPFREVSSGIWATEASMDSSAIKVLIDILREHV